MHKLNIGPFEVDWPNPVPFQNVPKNKFRINYFGIFNDDDIYNFNDLDSMLKIEDLVLCIVQIHHYYIDTLIYQDYYVNLINDEKKLSRTLNLGAWKMDIDTTNGIRITIIDNIGIEFAVFGEIIGVKSVRPAVFLDSLKLLKYIHDTGFKTFREFDIKNIIEAYKNNAPPPVKVNVAKPPAPQAPAEPIVNYPGLQSVKDEIARMVDYARIRKTKIDRGLMVTPSTLHMVFTGSPGTGKTTIARIIGEQYRKIGLLAKGHLVETNRADLVAEYVGQTAPKMRKVFESALGGVLFIDEAYTLSSGGDKDFGQEAINELMALMENYREQVVVIVAGYPDLMKAFIQANPGLDSRFPTKIHFDDYTIAELVDILQLMAAEQQHRFTGGALEKATLYLEHATENNPNFGNARGVRNLFEHIVRQQASRLSLLADPSDDQLLTFEAADISDNIAGL